MTLVIKAHQGFNSDSISSTLIDNNSHPYSEVVVMSDTNFEASTLNDLNLNISVKTQKRSSPIFMDICEARVSHPGLCLSTSGLKCWMTWSCWYRVKQRCYLVSHRPRLLHVKTQPFVEKLSDTHVSFTQTWNLLYCPTMPYSTQVSFKTFVRSSGLSITRKASRMRLTYCATSCSLVVHQATQFWQQCT